MQIKYRLLSTGMGILAERIQGVATGDVSFCFDGAPSGASAVFVTGRGTFCREIEEGTCALPASALSGRTEVGVLTTETDVPERWICEALHAKPLAEGVFIAPDGTDLGARVAALMLENEQLREENARIRAGMDDLERRFEKFFEGYDIV